LIFLLCGWVLFLVDLVTGRQEAMKTAGPSAAHGKSAVLRSG
jgi:hypothetical protein